MNDLSSVNNTGHHITTEMVHGGMIRTPFGETTEALFLSSGFVYDNAEQAEATFTGAVEHYQYSRFSNPTVDMLEARLCILEGAEACRCTASGMAAVQAALMSHLKTGDRLVAARALFGSCYWIVSSLLPRFGIETEFVDATDPEAWRAALSRPAAMVLLETPSNPMLDIIDLRLVADLAHAAGALLVVDNVFATPLLQRPMAFGADVVVYSCTKHMDGQGRVLGGAVLGRQAWVENVLQPFIRNTGPTLSPFNAWLLLKGLETMPLRVDASTRTATDIATFLAAQPEVKQVRYPGHASHPQYKLACEQMSGGGTLLAFELHGGKAAAFRMLNRLRLIAISNNLGDAKTLATHPATTTHMRVGEAERSRLGITDGVIRLSVGLEHKHDLINDLQAALGEDRS